MIAAVQGNLEALEAVCADLDRQRIVDVICLGSVLRWGPDPLACLDLVRERCRVVLRGWDEHLLFGAPGELELGTRRWREWLLGRLGPKERTWLASLPLRHDEAGRTFAYGDPRVGPEHSWEALVPDTFLQRPELARSILDASSPVLVGVGPEHRPLVWVEGEAEAREQPGRWRRSANDPRAVVWVGSVGQPRDRDRRATYAVIDGDTIAWRRVEYDVERTVAKIRADPALDERGALRLLEGI